MRDGIKRLAPGEKRYIAKSELVGRRTLWGVYDRVEGSWPEQRPVLGKVKQHMLTQEEAELEAARLEQNVSDKPEEIG